MICLGPVLLLEVDGSKMIGLNYRHLPFTLGLVWRDGWGRSLAEDIGKEGLLQTTEE
jgi:hypothetical protein